MITIKKFQHYIISVVITITLVSCASHKWTDVSDYVNTETILREKFQSLYSRYKEGEIMISKIEQSIDDNGEVKYRVFYSEKDDETDEMLWQTIYMPLLNE